VHTGESVFLDLPIAWIYVSNYSCTDSPSGASGPEVQNRDTIVGSSWNCIHTPRFEASPFVVSFLANGTYRWSYGDESREAHWAREGQQRYRISWPSGDVDEVTLATDGRSFAVTGRSANGVPDTPFSCSKQ
jgi:hypothetical protein